MEKIEQSKYTLEELEQFRDENGFIDLVKAGVKGNGLREYIGNQDRIKNWVDFAGTKALIKGETILEETKNYGIYAELIVEEIAKKMGISAAHYDLVKLLDEDGKEKLGVLSVSVVDPENKDEQLTSLAQITGMEPEDDENITTTNFEFTENRLKEELLKDGYSKENVEQLIKDYRKRSIFSLMIAEEDKHPENIAFIKRKGKDGKDEIELAPVFDSEASLLLDRDEKIVDSLMKNVASIVDAVSCAQPKIVTNQDFGYETMWKNTLMCLTDDNRTLDGEFSEELNDEMAEYISDTLFPFENLTEMTDFMDEVIGNVEARIHAELPENVKNLSRYAFFSRGIEFADTLFLDVDYTNQYSSADVVYDVMKKMKKEEKMKSSKTEDSKSDILSSLVGRTTGEKEGIKASELSSFLQSLGIGMFNNIENKEDEKRR